MSDLRGLKCLLSHLLYYSPNRLGAGGQLAGFGLGPQSQPGPGDRGGDQGQLPTGRSSPDSSASQTSGNNGEKKVEMGGSV